MSQAARYLGLSAVRVRQFLDEGRLPFQSTPYGRLVSLAELDRFAEEHRRQKEQRRRAVGIS